MTLEDYPSFNQIKFVKFSIAVRKNNMKFVYK